MGQKVEKLLDKQTYFEQQLNKALNQITVEDPDEDKETDKDLLLNLLKVNKRPMDDSSNDDDEKEINILPMHLDDANAEKKNERKLSKNHQFFKDELDKALNANFDNTIGQKDEIKENHTIKVVQPKTKNKK